MIYRDVDKGAYIYHSYFEGVVKNPVEIRFATFADKLIIAKDSIKPPRWGENGLLPTATLMITEGNPPNLRPKTVLLKQFQKSLFQKILLFL